MNLHRCRFLHSSPPNIIQLNKNVIVTEKAVHVLQESQIKFTIHGKFLNALLIDQYLYLLTKDTVKKLNTVTGEVELAHSMYGFVNFQIVNQRLYLIDGTVVQLADLGFEILKTYHYSSKINEFYTDGIDIVTAHDDVVQVRLKGELEYTIDCESPWCVYIHDGYVFSGHTDGIYIWKNGIFMQHLVTELDILVIKDLYCIGLQGALYELQCINDKWSFKNHQHIHSHESKSLYIDNFIYYSGLDGVVHKRSKDMELVGTIHLDLLIKSEKNKIGYANQNNLQVAHIDDSGYTINHEIEDDIVNYEFYGDSIVVQNLEKVYLFKNGEISQEWKIRHYMLVMNHLIYLMTDLGQTEMVNLQSFEKTILNFKFSTRVEKICKFESSIVVKCHNAFHIIENNSIKASFEFLLPVKDFVLFQQDLIVLSHKLYVFKENGCKSYTVDNYKHLLVQDAVYLYNRREICKIDQDFSIKRKLESDKLTLSNKVVKYRSIEYFGWWSVGEGIVVERPASVKLRELPPRLVGPWR